MHMSFVFFTCPSTAKSPNRSNCMLSFDTFFEKDTPAFLKLLIGSSTGRVNLLSLATAKINSLGARQMVVGNRHRECGWLHPAYAGGTEPFGPALPLFPDM